MYFSQRYDFVMGVEKSLYLAYILPPNLHHTNS